MEEHGPTKRPSGDYHTLPHPKEILALRTYCIPIFNGVKMCFRVSHLEFFAK